MTFRRDQLIPGWEVRVTRCRAAISASEKSSVDAEIVSAGDLGAISRRSMIRVTLLPLPSDANVRSLGGLRA